jgi:hypothetical protein
LLMQGACPGWCSCSPAGMRRRRSVLTSAPGKRLLLLDRPLWSQTITVQKFQPHKLMWMIFVMLAKQLLACCTVTHQQTVGSANVPFCRSEAAEAVPRSSQSCIHLLLRVATGTVHFVKLLTCHDRKSMYLCGACMQETAAAVVWALAFEKECREAVVAAGGIPSLIHLCAKSGSSAVQAHAAGGEEQLQNESCCNGSQLAHGCRSQAIPGCSSNSWLSATPVEHVM